MKTVQDWDEHKLVIALLYQNQNRPLRDVMQIMSSDYSFLASPKQYKDQLKKWGMMKNLNEKDVALCLYALEDIENGSRKQELLLRDRVMSRADINTYLKKTKRKAENLRAAIPRPAVWPSYITFRSPPSQPETSPFYHEEQDGARRRSSSQQDLTSPSSATTAPWNVWSSPNKYLTPSSSLSQRTSLSSMHAAPFESAYMADEGGLTIEYRRLGLSEPDETMEDIQSYADDEVSERDMATIGAGFAASNHFGMMVRQTVEPKPLAEIEKANPLYFTLLSQSAPSISHQDRQGAQDVSGAGTQAYESRLAPFVRPDRATLATAHSNRRSTETRNESTVSRDLSVQFLRQCLSACIVQGQGFREAATDLMHGAVQLFEGMISRRDPYSLTALNLLTTVLESVGQRPLAETILWKILESVHGRAGSEGPVITTICFMMEIVSGRAKESEYDANRMWQVYHELCELSDANSPSALAGLYHVAWRLALEAETRAEAWSILEPLKLKCEEILGQSHFQTITVMMTLARVLYNLEHHWGAACMINEAIDRLEKTYEDFHPVYLEVRARQAMLLMKLEGSHDVEPMLQDVLKQQVDILGLDNPRTQSTLATLDKFLKGRGRALNLHEILGHTQQ